MKHICTVHFFPENTNTNYEQTYHIYLHKNEIWIESLRGKTISQNISKMFIDILKEIGYKESDCVYWEHDSYCYHGWDITDIMKRPLFNLPDHFDFFIGDEDNGVPYVDN